MARFPPRLKPNSIDRTCGATKVAPFQNNGLSVRSEASTLLVEECSSCFVPFFCGDLPYLAGLPAGDEVPLFDSDEAHAGFFGIRRDAKLPTAFGARRTGNPSTSNQKSLTAMTASVMRPWPCHGRPSQKPRLSAASLCSEMTPMCCCGDSFNRRVQCHSSPRSIAGRALSR